MAIAAFPFGADVRVNSTTNGTQTSPAVAALKGGGFVVTWTSETVDSDFIYAQRYDSFGLPQGREITVDGTFTGELGLSSVTALADGGFLVTWQSAQNGGSWDIYARRYNASGVTTGPKFLVNASHQTGDQVFASVTELSGGGVVVTWMSPGQAGNGYDIYGQIFAPTGTLAGDELPLIQRAGDDLYLPLLR